jgi:hypothetical protein
MKRYEGNSPKLKIKANYTTKILMHASSLDVQEANHCSKGTRDGSNGA